MWVLAAALAALQSSPSGVVGWRGDAHGAFQDSDPPVQWDDRTNLRWVADTGATGYASPVIMNGKVFVVCEPDELYAVDLRDGKVLWKKKIAGAGEKLAKGLKGTGAAAATPCAVDGRIYVVLGTGQVACFREDGTEAWTAFLDQPASLPYGRSASPLLAGGRLLVLMDHLTALDPADGNVVWEAREALGSYGSPARARIGGTDVVVTPNGDVVAVADGRILLREIGQATHTTPLVHEDLVYFIDERASAVRLPPRVETSMEVQRLWSSEIEGETFASPVLHEGRLHTLNAKGMYRVLEAGTGKVLVEQQTELDLVDDDAAHLYPSVTLAGRHLFLSNDRGVTLLLEPGSAFKEVRRNRLESGAGSSPVFWGGRLFLRGDRKLFCVAQSP